MDVPCVGGWLVVHNALKMQQEAVSLHLDGPLEVHSNLLRRNRHLQWVSIPQQIKVDLCLTAEFIV